MLACLAAVELAGVAYFYWSTGRLIYLGRGSAAAVEPAPPVPEKRIRHRLHPYFGFAGPYDQQVGSLYTNNLGFLQREPVTIPFTPSANDVVVAVFGGSVAEKLVIGDAGGLPLREALQRRPIMAGKNVVLLNLAQGAAKQPQQLLTLAYLLGLGQRIDLVINIDGFNEFTMAYENHRLGLDPALPAAQMMVPLLMEIADAPSSGRYYELVARMLSSREAVARSSQALRSVRTGIGLVTAYVRATWSRKTYSKAVREYSTLMMDSRNWFALRERVGLDVPVRIPDAQIFPALFDLWLRSSQQMRILTEAQKGHYLHVIQPNQFYSKHPFTPREREIALSQQEAAGYRQGVERGYALLAARDAILQSNAIVSGVALFDDVADEVYSDNCCHYTGKGETLLAEFVAARAEQRLAAER
jgi:hypothetical protein